jgi:hypothetical protein
VGVTGCAPQIPARIVYINCFKGLRQLFDIEVRTLSRPFCRRNDSSTLELSLPKLARPLSPAHHRHILPIRFANIQRVEDHRLMRTIRE